MELNISKKINTSRVKAKKKNTAKRTKFSWKGLLKPGKLGSGDVSQWNLIYPFFVFIALFGVLIYGIVNLQIVKGDEMYASSENNQIKIESVSPLRGVIFDKNGILLAENVSSMNVYISVDKLLNSDGEIDKDELKDISNTLGGILKISELADSDGNKYSSIYDKVISIYDTSPYLTDILISSGIDNDTAIQIKALSLNGVYIDDGNKRDYPFKEVFSHILGYTGNVTAEDLESKDYVGYTDVVGRAGLEYIYDKELFGTSGKIAVEVDAEGNEVGTNEAVIQEVVDGLNLYLTIDSKVQEKLYQVLEKGIKDSDATGGAAIIENVNTGEILAIVTYPSYDNNIFIGGISTEDYQELVGEENNPLLNRAVSAQEPPGSTFKTIVASAALDAGAITKNTKYTSTSSYTFSNGVPFQEYRGHAYGTLNLIEALSVSSNIYFCEVIRHWDMEELVPYIEKFGIGQVTGIDIQGEASGRVPSPENKEILANTTSPWLDPIWYPEGDSCNSVIGQGITLVTPIQMANWIAAIANGGTLNTPHVAEKFVSSDGEESAIEFEPIGTKIVSESALATVREGMWSAVNGSRATITSLKGLGVEVAAKTGTAEFGELNEKGEYEHTHAWTTGFFPYDNPEYSFTIFLEDGGESYNAAYVARDMIKWMVEEGYVE